MATYGPGYVDQLSFGDGDVLLPGTVVGDGAVFCNSVEFGEGSIIGDGAQIIPCDYDDPPHKIGTAVAIGCGSTVIYADVGDAVTICQPAAYAPVSEGADVVVGNSPQGSYGEAVEREDTVCNGQEIVTGAETVSEEYDGCDKICSDGVVTDSRAGGMSVTDPSNVEVVDASRCIEGECPPCDCPEEVDDGDA